MLYSPTSILDRTVSKEILHKLCLLWEDIASSAGDDSMLFSETDLINQEEIDQKTLQLNWRWSSFKLLVILQWQAFLLIEDDPHKPESKISLTFDSQEIENFFASIEQKLPLHSNGYGRSPLPSEAGGEPSASGGADDASAAPKASDRIRSMSEEKVKHLSQLQNEFILQLLSILSQSVSLESDISLTEKISLIGHKTRTEKKFVPDTIYNPFARDTLVPESLDYQLEQQRIFERVKNQIDRNIDLLEILKITIEQVRLFLKVDRLVIYQLDVPVESVEINSSETQYIDTVTYEAIASEKVASILYFRDEICFSKDVKCKDKYRQGFSLVVDDVDANSNFPECLIRLMKRLQIKAKLVTPIIVHGKLWGFTIAHQCFSSRKWKNSETQFLKQISEYLAIAIYQNESYLQLQQQKKLLEEQVKKRAQQLQDALLAAQAATQSKNEFIGNMSHELRTPLTCVIGLSGTLLHWSLARGNTSLPLEKQRQYLKTIQDSGKHLLDLVNDILDFSEVESGKILLNFTEFSLYNLARSIVQSMQDEANKKQIYLELDFQVESTNDLFCADRDRVKQILINLLSNGIKFTPEEGRVVLRIWRENRDAIFEIEDTGIGIAKQHLPLLFEKFQQIESSRQRTHGGTGLGLALTKQLVELHKGRIEVESVADRGSIFTVYLPNQNLLKQKSDRHDESDERSQFQTKTIILIAKDEEISTLICELLMAANYQVVWLIDDSTAIEQIELLEPNLVLIDRDFAEIDIEKIGQTLKQFHKTKNIKVVVLCSQLTSSKWQELLENGVDDYLLKPLQPTYLLQKISSLI
jgi:two-component system sensor histidine kinase/response regulator